ncbi:uncharacterized protein LOC144578316 [Callithrix jacchus]
MRGYLEPFLFSPVAHIHCSVGRKDSTRVSSPVVFHCFCSSFSLYMTQVLRIKLLQAPMSFVCGNTLSLISGTRMNLENIILSKLTQEQKMKHRIFSLIGV